ILATALRLVAVRATIAGGAIGAAIPAVAGLTAALTQTAPAAGVAATSILAMVSASAALKIGMLGVEDALSVAFDPDKAEEFNEALARLSPNARSFVQAIRDVEPAFNRLRRAVQDRLFADL